eukprot:COSAG01_NODE_5917_length_3956_cov_40.956950_3_plen_136_part_00
MFVMNVCTGECEVRAFRFPTRLLLSWVPTRPMHVRVVYYDLSKMDVMMMFVMNVCTGECEVRAFRFPTRLLLSWVPTRPTHPWSMPYIVSSSIVLRSAIARSQTFRLFADSSAFSRSSLARAEGSIISITRYCQR